MGALPQRDQRLFRLHAPDWVPAPSSDLQQSDALRAEVEGAKADLAELEELREMKADVERKEKQQAAIIEGQVRPARAHACPRACPGV